MSRFPSLSYGWAALAVANLAVCPLFSRWSGFFAFQGVPDDSETTLSLESIIYNSGLRRLAWALSGDLVLFMFLGVLFLEKTFGKSWFANRFSPNCALEGSRRDHRKNPYQTVALQACQYKNFGTLSTVCG